MFEPIHLRCSQWLPPRRATYPAYLADFTDGYYRAYIESWRDLIASSMP